MRGKEKHLQLQTCETEMGFRFHSKNGEPKRHQPETAHLRGWIILIISLDCCDLCGRSISVWKPSKRESESVRSWTHPQHQRWLHEGSQQLGQSHVHGCSDGFVLPLLFTRRSSIHRSINWYPWKSRGGPATPDRTKHESASIPLARARLHTIVLLGPVSLNNRCLLQK